MPSGRGSRPTLLRVLALLGGVALVFIGLRFLLVPESASRFFGIDPPPGARPLLHVIALRDLWIGLLLLGLAYMAHWPGMALWLALAALVCFGDAWIAATASGRPAAVTFHLCSGVGAVVLALACHREARRMRAPDSKTIKRPSTPRPPPVPPPLPRDRDGAA